MYKLNTPSENTKTLCQENKEVGKDMENTKKETYYK